jgi:hypothetical protein
MGKLSRCTASLWQSAPPYTPLIFLADLPFFRLLRPNCHTAPLPALPELHFDAAATDAAGVIVLGLLKKSSPSAGSAEAAEFPAD